MSGTACTLHIGAVTYFRGDTLNFYWRDPPPEYGREIEVPFDDDAWRYYYGPIVETIRGTDFEALRRDTDHLVPVEGADLQVGVHPVVARYLVDEQWEHARAAATEAQAEISSAGYQPDGLKVAAGKSWSARFAEQGVDER